MRAGTTSVPRRIRLAREERIVGLHHVPDREHRHRTPQRAEVRVAQAGAFVRRVELADHEPHLDEVALQVVLHLVHERRAFRAPVA